MEGGSSSWTPGQPISIETRRLWLRTLTPEDVTDDDVLRWTGDEARTAHVWSPAADRAEYMRGLARVCDNRTHFALGVFHKKSDQLIGYLKIQIDPRARALVPTTVIGDARFAGGYFGTEAARAAQRFLLEHLELDAIMPRVYADNAGTLRLLERFGYSIVQRYPEKAPGGGPVREVCVLYISRQDWFAHSPEGEARLAQAPDID